MAHFLTIERNLWAHIGLPNLVPKARRLTRSSKRIYLLPASPTKATFATSTYVIPFKSNPDDGLIK